MNDIQFGCKGFWYADEIADLVEQRFGFAPEVSTAEGGVVVHPRPRALEEDEIKLLRKYLKEHPQKSSEEREREREQAVELRRKAIVARVCKVTDDTSAVLQADDVRDAIRALAELLGVDIGTAKGTEDEN